MIELFEHDLKDDGRRSSKGNQLKWESGGVWYKADYTGYEGLTEYVVSECLKRSSLSTDEFTEYYPENIKYKSRLFNGCKSRDFSNGWQTITLERLFKNNYGTSLNKGIYSIEDHAERLKYLVAQVERATGVMDFGIYISKMMTIDAFFLNEDRHTHNISVLWNGQNEYCLCPFYDQGAALMSDTTLDYPLGCDVLIEKNRIHSKTFCTSFDEQLDLAEELYGRHLVFFWGAKDVDDILGSVNGYDEQIISRVRDLLLEQRRKYGYLFA